MSSYSYSSTNVSGNFNGWNNLTSISTGTTFTPQETEEDARKRKKKLIESIIDGDDYLLQELIIDLRRKKLDQLKNKK